SPTPSDPGDAYYDDPGWDGGTSAAHEADFDPLNLVATPMTLNERVLIDLEALLSEEHHLRIAAYLVGNLDDNGRLRCSVREASSALGVAAQDVEYVLSLLQSLEPIGIGARDVRECLLLQVAYLEAQGVKPPYVREIIADYFDELAEHKYPRIAQ